MVDVPARDGEQGRREPSQKLPSGLHSGVLLLQGVGDDCGLAPSLVGECEGA